VSGAAAGRSMTKLFRIPPIDEVREAPKTKKPKLAVVSTFDDLCGIAGYTRFLLKQIESDFDVDVFDLDQFFMRSTNRRVRKIADRMVRDFCERARTFDFVNIQLEHGTLGKNWRDIIRRFRWIAEASPALSVTMHTIFPHETLDPVALARELARLRLRGALGMITSDRNAMMNRAICDALRRLSKHKPVNVIVHTRRDRLVMRHVHRLPSVFDHPLSFLDATEAAALRATTARSSILGLSRLPQGAKVIGVFGFISEYKGFEVVIRAMHLLPDDYHLLIFGGVHPHEIKREEKIYPYVRALLNETYVDRSVFDGLADKSVSVAIDSTNTALLIDHPKNIGQRIHFLGPQTDEGFAKGMAVCDHVVVPYLEIGQSSSGVLSIALDMGSRIIAARNHAFMQFARYHPNSVEFFEIGNHLELAERILATPAYPPEGRPNAYNVSTNRALYVAANSANGRVRQAAI
jgi:glycosyltransferase involved in cell wall biosynthesis